MPLQPPSAIVSLMCSISEIRDMKTFFKGIGLFILGVAIATAPSVSAQQPVDTELPAAAALGDNTANPTVTSSAAFLMCFDGSTWDRCQISADGTHDSPVGASGPQFLIEAKDFDGAALPNTVAEGDAIRAAGSQSGVGYFMWVTEDGSKQISKLEDDAHATADAGVPIWTRRRDTATGSSGTEGDYQTLDTDSLGRVWVRNGDPCSNHARIQNVKIDTATSGNVQLVALSGSDVIYVCGYHIIAASAQSVQLIHGTGSACATGETDAEGPLPLAANGGIAIPVTGSAQFKTAAGEALCIELSAATQISGAVRYVQTAAP